MRTMKGIDMAFVLKCLSNRLDTQLCKFEKVLRLQFVYLSIDIIVSGLITCNLRSRGFLGSSFGFHR